ncbi:MAG: WalW protein [Alteromonadaceae bacterium]|nr:WalW protein [Alteromonadaceae bacterium]
MDDSSGQILFVLSVDTEEEWDWSGPFPEDNFCVKNIKELPAFQFFCQELGIKPTYFVDYAVANDLVAANTLKALNKSYCEIGAHLHPWVNPPFFDDTCEASSHVVNLPIDHVKQKLLALNKKIIKEIGQTPKSFRTGRWGINGEILKLLHQEGISVDSSVYPLYKSEYFSCESAPNIPYWPDLNDTNKQADIASTNANEHNNEQCVLEIPVTVGFNRPYYSLAQKLHKMFAKPPFIWLRINGFLWHTKVLRKLYLCPELCSADNMKTLVDGSLKKGHTVLHMYFHSSSLIENVTGLSSQSNARETICQQIREVIEHLQKNRKVKFCTISEAKEIIINHEKNDKSN